MPDELIAIGRDGRPQRLIRVGNIREMGDVEVDDDELDESGALIRVEHTLDPEAQATLRDLRRGAPMAAAVGGALAGAALILLILWVMSEDEGEDAEEG